MYTNRILKKTLFPLAGPCQEFCIKCERFTGGGWISTEYGAFSPMEIVLGFFKIKDRSSASSTFLQHLIVRTTLTPLDSLFSFRLQNTTLSWFSFYPSNCPFTNLSLATLLPSAPQVFSSGHFTLLYFVCSLDSLHGQFYPLPQLQLTPKFWIYWWLQCLHLQSQSLNLAPISQSQQSVDYHTLAHRKDNMSWMEHLPPSQTYSTSWMSNLI